MSSNTCKKRNSTIQRVFEFSIFSTLQKRISSREFARKFYIIYNVDEITLLKSYIVERVALLKKFARWKVCTKVLLIDVKCIKHRRMLWRNIENSNAIFVYQAHVIKIHALI